MYVRLVFRNLRPGYWDEFERYYNERYLPATKDTPGLQRRELLRSTENPDEGMAFGLWDSLESLLAYDRSPVRKELTKGFEEFYPLFAYSTGDYWVKYFELMDSTTY